MPKDTFYNLPKDKQDRILNVAVKEFSNNGYQNSSIQTIADEAGVSKGSMYQYFESKKELFFYIIEMACSTKVKILTELITDNHYLRFFELIEKILLSSIKYAQEYPELYQFYQNVQQGLSLDIKRELDERISILGQMQNRILLKEALEKGEIRNDISLDLANFIVFNQIKNFGDYLLNSRALKSEDEFKKYVYQFIEIMKNGLNG